MRGQSKSLEACNQSYTGTPGRNSWRNSWRNEVCMRCFDLTVPKTAHSVVVDDAHGLHERVRHRGAHELEPLLPQSLADGSGQVRGSWDVPPGPAHNRHSSVLQPDR